MHLRDPARLPQTFEAFGPQPAHYTLSRPRSGAPTFSLPTMRATYSLSLTSHAPHRPERSLDHPSRHRSRLGLGSLPLPRFRPLHQWTYPGLVMGWVVSRRPGPPAALQGPPPRLRKSRPAHARGHAFIRIARPETHSRARWRAPNRRTGPRLASSRSEPRQAPHEAMPRPATRAQTHDALGRTPGSRLARTKQRRDPRPGLERTSRAAATAPRGPLSSRRSVSHVRSGPPGPARRHRLGLGRPAVLRCSAPQPK